MNHIKRDTTPVLDVRYFYTYLKHLNSPSEVDRTTEISKILSLVIYFQTQIITFSFLVIFAYGVIWKVYTGILEYILEAQIIR